MPTYAVRFPGSAYPTAIAATARFRSRPPARINPGSPRKRPALKTTRGRRRRKSCARGGPRRARTRMITPYLRKGHRRLIAQPRSRPATVIECLLCPFEATHRIRLCADTPGKSITSAARASARRRMSTSLPGWCRSAVWIFLRWQPGEPLMRASFRASGYQPRRGRTHAGYTGDGQFAFCDGCRNVIRLRKGIPIAPLQALTLEKLSTIRIASTYSAARAITPRAA